MKTNKLYLASNLKFLRVTNNKTQEDIAKICNKKNTAISNWEQGIREPDAVDLSLLSNYFNVSIDDLMLKNLCNVKDSKPMSRTEILFDKTKDILSDDDRATIEFIMNKTIENYEETKKNNN